MSVATTVNLQPLIDGTEADPHQILGPHGDTVRAWRPDAASVTLVLPDGKRTEMKREHDAGVFVAKGVKFPADADYRLDVT